MQTLVPHHFKVLQIAMIERIINCLKFMNSFFELFFLVYFRTSGLISFSRKLQFLLKQFYYLKIYFYKTSLFRLNLKSCIFFFSRTISIYLSLCLSVSLSFQAFIQQFCIFRRGMATVFLTSF